MAALDDAEVSVKATIVPTGADITRRYHAAVATGPTVGAGCPDVPLLRTAYGARFLSRPVFLDAAEHAALDRDLRQTFDLLVSLPERIFGGDLGRFAAAVGMAPVQVEAVLRNAAVAGGPERIARADLYRESDGFRLLEFNMGSALGGFENAEINRAFLADAGHRAFIDDEKLRYADTLRRIVETMFAAVGPPTAGERPVVALVDWPSSFTSLAPRLRFMAQLLAPMGIDAIACHVGQLSTGADGALYVEDRRIDVVYRFFLIEDLLDGPQAPALVGRILDAVERGTVRLFAALTAELYGNKGCLALLGDETHRHLFTPDERAFLDRFLPWTRALRDGTVEVAGERVDLVTYALANREHLVLKPTLLHGGQGIVCGWTVSDEQWHSAIEAATGAAFVLQRRVRPIAEPFPRHDGAPGTEPLFLNWGAFLTDAGYSGAVVRGSADAEVGIVSMANGARVGCCFHPADGTDR